MTHQSVKIEDSVAAMGREPRRVQGMTAFLRKEYYRRLGVYINRARDEGKKLFQFWKSHVSEVYRKKREDKLLAQKMADPYALPPQNTQNQAVPAVGVKSELEREYDVYGKCFELDVAFTVDKDLEDEA